MWIFFTLVVRSAVLCVLMPCSCFVGTRSPPCRCQGCVWVGDFVYFLLFFLFKCLLSKFFVSVTCIGGFLKGDRGMAVWGPPGARIHRSLLWGLWVTCEGLQGSVPPCWFCPYPSVSSTVHPMPSSAWMVESGPLVQPLQKGPLALLQGWGWVLGQGQTSPKFADVCRLFPPPPTFLFWVSHHLFLYW